MKKLLIITAVLTTAVAAASAAPRDRDAVPRATPDGKEIDCVRTSSIGSTRVHGDSVIDFHMLGGRVYRNTLPNSCPSLGFEERFLYRTSIGELCSIDTITVLQSPGLSQGATCGLGPFQPIKLEKVAAR